MEFKSNDAWVAAHMVIGDDKFLGCVLPGCFASNAWIDGEPYRTMTGRVEVIWADDCKTADMDRNYLRQIETVSQLEEIISSGKYEVHPNFKLWMQNSPNVVCARYGIFKKE